MLFTPGGVRSVRRVAAWEPSSASSPPTPRGSQATPPGAYVAHTRRQPGHSIGQHCAHPSIHPGVGDGWHRGVIDSQGVIEEGGGHALEYIKRARKKSAVDKIAKAVQALRFAEEKELDIKERRERSIHQAISRKSTESPWRGCRREWQDRGASCTVSGRWSTSTVGSGVHRVAPTSCSVTGRGSDLSSGSQHGLCPDEHGRSCSVDGRPSEGFAGGHVKWENPRCHKIGAVGRRWRSHVEDVDGKITVYGRQFSGHGAMSASLERFRINCESNRQ